MTQEQIDTNNYLSKDGKYLGQDHKNWRLDLRRVDFPSDALSLKRFRKIFPDSCDLPGRIYDGFYECTFFTPSHIGPDSDMQKLTNLLSNERAIINAAFFRQLQSRDKSIEVVTPEEFSIVSNLESQLVAGYLHFQLADSPETAKLLIHQLNEEGIKHAEACFLRSK